MEEFPEKKEEKVNIIEREINLSLINDKTNYLLSHQEIIENKLEDILNLLKNKN